MANRLTDRQKKKILADYLEMGSYNAVAKKHKISDNTVKRVVLNSGDFAEKMERKKAQNTADILEYMESKKEKVCEIIGVALEVLPEKIRTAKTASEVTTAMGTLIDKWTPNKNMGASREDDPLSKSLEELAKGLKSDDKH